MPTNIADAASRVCASEGLLSWMEAHPALPSYIQAVLVPAAILATLWAAVFPLTRQRRAEQAHLLRLSLEAARAVEELYLYLGAAAEAPPGKGVCVQQHIDYAFSRAATLFDRVAIHAMVDRDVALDMDELRRWLEEDVSKYSTFCELLRSNSLAVVHRTELRTRASASSIYREFITAAWRSRDPVGAKRLDAHLRGAVA